MKYLKLSLLTILSLILCQCGAMQEKYNTNFPLHEAVMTGNLAKLKSYVAKGSYIDSRDRWGRTPLHLAAHKGNQQAVLYLIRNGASLTAKEQNGYTPSGYAKQAKQYTTMNLILANGGNAEYDINHKKRSNAEGWSELQGSLENAARAWSF